MALRSRVGVRGSRTRMVLGDIGGSKTRSRQLGGSYLVARVILGNRGSRPLRGYDRAAFVLVAVTFRLAAEHTHNIGNNCSKTSLDLMRKEYS